MGWAPKRVVVTGGAGFIGSHLVGRLLEATRAEVVVLDDFSRGHTANLARHAGSPRLHVAVGDVRDPACVCAALRGGDVVFHLAGQEADDEGSFGTNVVGTFTVLRAARELGLRRVLVTSCWEVYGEPLELPVCEDHPLLPVTPCGASKAAAEAYCRSFRRTKDLSIVVLRLGDVYGPRDRTGSIAAWIAGAVAGLDISSEAGKTMRDVVWVGDVVTALLRAAELDQPLPPINVATGTGTRPLDAARRIARLAGRPGRVVLLPAGDAGPTRFVANVDRMRHLLGIEPPLDPLAHLPELVAAARSARPRQSEPPALGPTHRTGRCSRLYAAARL